MAFSAIGAGPNFDEEARMLEQEERDKKRARRSRCSCFEFAIYIPKFVMIKHTRLAVTYYVLTFLLILFIIWYFLANSEYTITKQPWTKVLLCTDGRLCQPTPSELVANYMEAHSTGVCHNTSRFDYWLSPHDKFQPTGKLNNQEYGCRRPCAVQSAANATRPVDGCVLPKDVVKVQSELIFVPTYTKEITYTPKVNSRCPNSYSQKSNITADVCTRETQLFMPAAEKVKVKFSHEFMARPELGAFVFGFQDKKASSLTSESQGYYGGVATVFYDHSGKVVRRWKPGQMIDPTVEELLGAAHYDDVGASGSLTLDQRYERLQFGVPSNLKVGDDSSKGVSLRMTGVGVTVDLAITDTGTCRHVKLEEDFDVSDEDGPVACMFAHAERTWIGQGDTKAIGLGGGYKTTWESGVRIRFRTKGFVNLFDISVVSRNTTIAIVWIQMPLWIVYLFTTLFLGHLSSIYGRVIHENVNLGEECKGLATRLIEHSASYMDLQDRPDGITKGRLLERFRDLLKLNTDIDDAEITRYVDFVFQGMQSTSESNTEINETVSLAEFCSACSTNEALDPDSMAMLFDKDRHISFLENFFLDTSIRSVLKLGSGTRDSTSSALMEQDSSHGLSEEQEAREAQERNAKEMATMTATSAKIKETKSLSEEILKTCQVNAMQDKELALRAAPIAKDRRDMGKSVIDPFVDFEPTQDPKPDQRESVCSIADEDDPGRDPALECI